MLSTATPPGGTTSTTFPSPIGATNSFRRRVASSRQHTRQRGDLRFLHHMSNSPDRP
jgi:hypothetical protein